jgi:hypothetical protein
MNRKEVKMIIRKTVSLVGSLLILGLGYSFGQEQSKKAVRSEIRNKVQTEVQAQTKAEVRNRWMFVDENGDGINDFARDHDNDGIPNCQDPDWTRPEDGSGAMNRFKNASEANKFEYRNRQFSGTGWNKASFRNSSGGFGQGFYGRSSGKGRALKQGRR